MKLRISLIPLLIPLMTANLFAQSRYLGLTGPAMQDLLDFAGKDAQTFQPKPVEGKAVEQNKKSPPAAQAKPDAGLTVYVKFNGVTASKGPVPAQETLSQFGITVAQATPGTQVFIVDSRNEYEGKAVVPPSREDPNLLTQKGQNGPISFTLNFARAVCGFSFTRPALIAGENGISHPRWSARAYSSSGKEIAALEEDMIRHFDAQPYPAKTFTLDKKDAAEGISSVRIDSDGDLYFTDAQGNPQSRHFAAFSGVLLSNVTIQYCSQ